MLELLRIHDLALIEDIEMEFCKGMNVLTGETGAGKSFILKALSFVTGEKLSTENVRPGKEKAVVEGLFSIDNEQYVLRRELIAETGRSRFYINDRLSSQEAVKDLKTSLLLHTSQHGQQKLLQPAFQAELLDQFLHEPVLLAERDTTLEEMQACRTKRKKLEELVLQLEEKREMLEYQQTEIAKVAPYSGEEEELEAKRNTVRNAEVLQDSVQLGIGALRGNDDGMGMYHQLGILERSVLSLCKHDETFADVHSLVTDIGESVRDVEKKLHAILGDTDIKSINVEKIEARLYALAQLKRKLKRPLEAIIALHTEVNENLSFLDSCELDRKEIAKEETECCDRLARVLEVLNKKREQAGHSFTTELEEVLKGLGFSEHVQVRFEFVPQQLHPDREDCIELRPRLLWQPNPGQAEQPLERIASGGELSRFLLAVVSIMTQSSGDDPTLIFDEVDSGVGGLTLNKVADALEELALNRQMILITHWPQLAKRGKRHFVIDKTVVEGETFTTCRRLMNQEIIETELARMAGES